MTAERVVSGNKAYHTFTPSQIVAMQSIKENLDAGFTLKADVQKVIKTTSFKNGGYQNA